MKSTYSHFKPFARVGLGLYNGLAGPCSPSSLLLIQHHRGGIHPIPQDITIFISSDEEVGPGKSTAKCRRLADPRYQPRSIYHDIMQHPTMSSSRYSSAQKT